MADPEDRTTDDPTPDTSTVATAPDPESVPDLRRDAVGGPEPSSPKATEPAPEPARRGGTGSFLALVLGGIVAGLLGFAFAKYVVPDFPNDRLESIRNTLGDQSRRMDDTAAALADNGAKIAALEQRPEPQADAAVTGRLDALEAAQKAPPDAGTAEIRDALRSQQADVASLTARIAALEARPVATPGTAPETEAALTALRQELDAQKAANSEMSASVAAAAQAAQAQVDAAAQAAQARVDAAQAEAKGLEARVALGRIEAAVTNGGPFGPALDDLAATGIRIPEPLRSVEDGVPTLSDLQQSFPEPARAALAAARQTETSSGIGARFGAFTRAQLGVRSLAPRSGDDADAVLSRAEAAVTSGDIDAATNEISALPEPGRQALADWTAHAQTRLDALAALLPLKADVGGASPAPASN